MKKQFPLRLDPVVHEALQRASKSAGISIAKYLHQLLVRNLKASGQLPDDYVPTRSNWGGYRQGKRSPGVDDPTDSD